MDKKILEFPKEFLFGSATAAHQVEGNEGERNTDWDVFMKQYPEIINMHEKGPEWWKQGRAEHDIQTMANLGMKVQRIGISWGRIEPQKGNINLEAVARYKEIIKKIIDSGMIPMITLNHYVLPQWVAREGSWENKRTIGHFEHFVKFAVLEFPEVKYWLTLNEPNILVILGYFSKYYPPAKNSLFSASVARFNMLEAHRKAYKKIKSISPMSKVGLTFAFRWNLPEHKNYVLDKWYAKLVNHISVGSYVEATKKYMDFIGCNYYTGYYLNLDIRKLKFRARHTDKVTAKTLLFGETRKPASYKSDYGWPIVPDFFLEVLRYLNSTFNLPIIITENGLADKEDKRRSFFILTHLVAVWKAVQEGAKIQQYLHWSTVDNLEWILGYTKDFGLIDNNPITGERKLRNSAHLYSEIVRESKIDIDKLISKYLLKEEGEKAQEVIERMLL
jgi:beta-glucosidase